jgi:hypothetical protein
MQTRDSDDSDKKQAAVKEKRRDPELENIVGNLLIDEYQVDKLQTRLAKIVYSYGYGYGYDYDYGPQMSNNNKASTHVFKRNNKWYKISLRINETDATGNNKDGQDYMTGMTGYSSKR